MKRLLAIIALTAVSGIFLFADEPAGGGDGKGDRMKGMGENQRAAMFAEYLKKTDPAKFEELEKLKKEKPDEYRKQVDAMKAQAMEKFKKERDEFKALSDKYRDTKSDTDKAALKAKMEENMKKKIEFQKQRIADMEKSLSDAKAKLEDTEKNMQAKIEEKLNEILAGKDSGKEVDEVKKKADAGK